MICLVCLQFSDQVRFKQVCSAVEASYNNLTMYSCYMHRSRGSDRGTRPHPPPPPPPPPLLKNPQNIGFLSNTGRDPLEITKLPSQHSMLGHHLHASETPFKWPFPGGQMMPAYSGIWILTSLVNKKTKQKKTLSKFDPSDKTFWICVCVIYGL